MANVQQFLKDAKKELKKVQWPDKPKVVENSLVVAACTLFFAAYLYGVDVLINQVFSFLY